MSSTPEERARARAAAEADILPEDVDRYIRENPTLTEDGWPINSDDPFYVERVFLFDPYGDDETPPFLPGEDS